jgi:nitrite reductase/ring-hydroxylating ferredoxin subunit
MKHSNLHIFFLSCILLSGLSSSCEKRQEHPVPSTYVNFVINLQTDPEFIRLTAIGNSVEIFASTIGASLLGYDNNGVVIYNAGDDEFYAFDRTCPFDIPISVAIESDGTNGLATCPLCGTIYVFASEGRPTFDGPGTWALKKYRAYFNPNTGELHVYN